MALCFARTDDVGEKLLGVCIPILVCLPIFWIFGEPLSGPPDRAVAPRYRASASVEKRMMCAASAASAAASSAARKPGRENS